MARRLAGYGCALLTAALASGCGSGTQTAPVVSPPPVPAAAPAAAPSEGDSGDVFAVLQLPGGDVPADVGAVVEALSPGSSGNWRAILVSMKSSLLQLDGPFDLSGAELSAPLSVFAVDPNRHGGSLALLVTARDVGALKSAAQSAGYAVTVREGRALVGRPQVIEAVQAFAFAQSPSSERTQLRVYPKPLLAAYRDSLTHLASHPNATDGVSAAFARMSQLNLTQFAAVAAQSDFIDITFEARDTGVDFFLVAQPQAGSTLESFVAAQRPSDFALLQKIPKEVGSTVVAAGSLRAGAAREAAMAAMQEVSKAVGDNAGVSALLTESTERWFAIATGDFAGRWAMPRPQMALLLGATDGAAIRDLWRDSMSRMAAMSESDSGAGVMGVKARMTVVPGALRHRNIEIDRYENEIDREAMPPEQVAMLAQLDALSSVTHMATLPTLGTMVMGADGERLVKAILDAVVDDRSAVGGDAAIEAQFAHARARGESALMVMDFSSLIPSPMPVIAIGMSGRAGALTLRLGLTR